MERVLWCNSHGLGKYVFVMLGTLERGYALGGVQDWDRDSSRDDLEYHSSHASVCIAVWAHSSSFKLNKNI